MTAMHSTLIVSEDDAFPWHSRLNGYPFRTTISTTMWIDTSQPLHHIKSSVLESVRTVNNKIQDLGVDAKAYAIVSTEIGERHRRTAIKLNVLFNSLTDQAMFSLADTGRIILYTD